jgi:hypothetical protein
MAAVLHLPEQKVILKGFEPASCFYIQHADTILIETTLGVPRGRYARVTPLFARAVICASE